MPSRAGAMPQSLSIGFSGGSPAHLHAVFDAAVAETAFVAPMPADWVEDHVQDDYAVKKLSSYLQQPELSLRQAMATFRETFLGE
jgi:type VI secretion system protein ImpM